MSGVVEGVEGALGGVLGLVLLGVLVLLALGWYLSYLAGRLDRLHHRVESAYAALEARLAGRAAVAREVGHLLEPPGGAEVVAAAGRALTNGSGARAGLTAVPRKTGAPAPGGAPGDAPRDAPGPGAGAQLISERCENELTRALHRAFEHPGTAARLRADVPGAGQLLEELVGAVRRVQLARRFHNDAVAHAQRMRRKRVVRWARLAGHARMPQMVELDDSPPLGLGADHLG